MSNIKAILKKNWAYIILWTAVITYITYFSVFTILRSQNLYAHYFDLGIMHQTVFNTFEALKTGDYSRFLEMTDPNGLGQIKRMAVHNDFMLALLAPFYFIYSGPETLLVLQSVILGLGALAVFGIVQEVFIKDKRRQYFGLFFTLAYLLYTPMQRANIFDFHAVTLATSLLLFMFYFWLKKKYRLSILFLCLSLLTKEQIGLTTVFFGFYILFTGLKNEKLRFIKSKKGIFSLLIIGLSFGWFIISILVIVPFFRGSNHFALEYYSDFGNSPPKILTGLIQNPAVLGKYIYHIDTVRYFFFLLGPLGFTSLFSPLLLFISAPEFAINLLSSSWNMRNIIFHYTSVIEPFVFISSVYGTKTVLDFLSKHKKYHISTRIIFFSLSVTILLFSYFKGPLPFSREADLYPLVRPNNAKNDTVFWSKRLSDQTLKISTTGNLAPYFASRRFYYYFPNGYEKADYVIVKNDELSNYFDPKVDIMGVYRRLQKDVNFQMVFKSDQIEIYKKL